MRWFLIPRRIELPNRYRSWGQWYKDTNYLRREAFKYFVESVKTPKYDAALGKYPFLLHQEWAVTQQLYYNEKLMAHMRRHLAPWQNFRALRQTYLVPTKIMFRVDGDLEILTFKMVTVEQKLYTRDKLIQIFDACPEGSYGYYAKRGLSPVKFLVRSFAAARIDEFFASCAHFLKQPFGPSVDNVMSAAETLYWNSRKVMLDYVAGQVIGQKGRSNTVWLAARVTEFIEGRRRSKLPEDEELTESDWDELADLILAMAKQIDADIADGLGIVTGERFDELVAAKKKPDEE